ncbi:pectate lyase family protein [Clostridium cellulovorans]|uniref:Pectate lyase/Amb allergen n=2 Tax=Clostridium cellulovorans TaxID=1493 RepID=D9SUM3_CLOC7|nr:pectate lyase [Clostridium cellulovorans]ADL50928.1 Pectate lyase/Amb allergen [Clostridium cellulovorans 743B]BAV13163.1 pectate lyase [Clostridium cellulovorans]
MLKSKKILSTMIATLVLSGAIVGNVTTTQNVNAAVSGEKAIGYGANATGGGDTKNIFYVNTKKELLAAISAKIKDAKGTVITDAPKIIVIQKDINLCSDSTGKEYIPGVSDPKTMPWKSGSDMASDVIVRVKSNTTLIGKDGGVTLSGGGIKLGTGTNNVVIKNISFEDAYDFFPIWSSNEWNTELDNMCVEGATNVWIDHCTFSDGKNPEKAKGCTDKNTPIHHDGLLDVKAGADNVSISHCLFKDHLKVDLLGSSDKAESKDGGKLHVTFYENYYTNTHERLPRVRFGHVHALNNYYEATGQDSIAYVFGMGLKSTLYSEGNIFNLNPTDMANNKTTVMRSMNTGTPTYYFQEAGSILNGNVYPTQVLGASKPAYDTTAKPGYSYVPKVVTVSNYKTIAQEIVNNAGAGK